MLIYNLVIRIYSLLIRLLSLRNQKAKNWIDGRKNWRSNLTLKLKEFHQQKKIWMHCSSYGEFEQGRPILEAIRIKYPDTKIILSFFSPSGYEAFKNWSGANVICYLPIDSKKNAKDFLQIVKPNLVIFIKYEFWLHYLFQLFENKTTTLLVSAVFKKHHPFFKWYGGIFRRSLLSFTKIFVQDKASETLLSNIKITQVSVSGDTRFDRVLEVKNSFKSLALFDNFCNSKQILIGGSTWLKDEELLIKAYKKINKQNLRMILVPHEVDKKSIQNLENRLSDARLSYALYSSGQFNSKDDVLVVDTMGLLSRLYHYANVAYIGGGFNSGIHNCLEAAVYLKPVLFHGGEHYTKYNEAVDLIQMDVAKNIENVDDLVLACKVFLDDEHLLPNLKSKLEAYFDLNSGTTQKVMDQVSAFD